VERVGLIGVGTMGEPVGRRLLAAGFPLAVPPRSAERTARLGAAGAQVLASVAEVVAASDVVLLLLPRPDVADAVVDEVAAAAREGQLCVEHGTVGPRRARRAAGVLAARGVAYLDAPVSGGPGGAAEGTLTAMVGGDPDVLARARPVLEASCARIRRCGDVGAGQVVKLVNQLLVGVHTAASAEAAVLGAALGADPDALADVLGTSFGASRMLERNLPRMVARDFSPATTTGVLLKDLGLIAEEAETAGCPLPLGALARERFAEGAARGWAGEDMAGLVRLWEEAAGTEVRPAPPAPDER